MGRHPLSDNPFAEPGDQDRTIIRPMPGGSRAAARSVPADQSPAAPPPVPPGPDIEVFSAGTGPLAIAASPLLTLLARLGNTATPPDSGDMRERTHRELRAFERRAKEAGVPADQVRLAHYALCAALDDVVLNTPWGHQGRWQQEPLARALHHDDQAGRGFFEQLRTLRTTLPASLPVMEVMFVCLCLGMAGPYRTAPDGPAQLERVRHHVFELIEKAAPAAPAALASAVTGVDASAAPRRPGIPVWVGASLALACIAGAYAWSLSSLNAASDTVYQAALAAPPASMPALTRPPATPPPPPPPEPAHGPAERLRAALAGAADVEVIGTPAETILRIPAHALFPQPNATLRGGALLTQIGRALQPEAGPIRIFAYTDNGRPPRSVGFPSNFALSSARARAVRAALARALPAPSRITAEGRADADPVAPNDTAAGREQNRRIDILLPAGG